ncbi:hypothetical protein C9413_26655 [Rhizobium sp. SEMIA 4085]|uniref:LysR substrate-binding domain-containing protein n=1 Tax=Rhizobium TaxID=379 RepID=UPI000B0F7364|nr:LysR substrate-binding domain-containing protein [Rhizobium gallicum]NNH32890.1 hypothetical protein [Rhizobium sp. SEMIA 4085]
MRLTTTRSIADLVIAPRLGDVLRGLADVELEIVTDIRVQSLAQREADIALWLRHPKNSDLTGKRVATIGYAFYASKAAAETVAESGPARLIGFDLDSDGVAEARWLETKFGPDAFVFRSSSNVVPANAAAAGLGIAMLPRFVAKQNPALWSRSIAARLCPIANSGCLPRPIWSISRASARYGMAWPRYSLCRRIGSKPILRQTLTDASSSPGHGWSSTRSLYRKET